MKTLLAAVALSLTFASATERTANELYALRDLAQLDAVVHATPCPATPIVPPVTIHGSIGPNSCTDEIGLKEDVYSVRVPRGGTLEVDYSSTAFETFLYIGLGNGGHVITTTESTLSSGVSRMKARHTVSSETVLLIEAESLYSRPPTSQPWSGPYTLTVRVSGGQPPTTTSTVVVVPVVGHLTGANGSEFRSDIKFHNRHHTAPVTGRMMFTPIGNSPSIADPQIAFTVPPKAVVFYEDVYRLAYPNGSGAARVMILNDANIASLEVDTSTYTKLANGGELGQSPTVFTGVELSGSPSTHLGILGKEAERTNVFVITGDEEAVVRWTYRDPNGVQLAQFEKRYSKDATHQISAGDLLAPVIPTPNGTIEAFLQDGEARFALSPVNNISNQGRWIDFKR